MHTKKAYVAGKITGDKNYKAKFDNAVLSLRLDGWAVMNPAILPDGFDYDDYMTVCFAMIDVCDTVFFLPDWIDSPGAMREHDYAIKSKKKRMYLYRRKP